jgi:hypothetical protein
MMHEVLESASKKGPDSWEMSLLEFQGGFVKIFLEKCPNVRKMVIV